MSRFTEYHGGVPVIKNKSLLPGAMKKLATCENAEQDGRLIIFPCKVGDYLYVPDSLRNTTSKYEITGFTINQYGICMIHWSLVSGVSVWRVDGCYPKSIGENVFLTREEAEQKLKEKRGN